MPPAEESSSTEKKILERGHLYFLFRPRPETAVYSNAEAGESSTAQQVWMVLSPEHRPHYRLIRLEPKQLDSQTFRGTVAAVARSARDLLTGLDRVCDSDTSIEQEQAETQPGGEGIYSLVQIGEQTHWLYILDLPPILGPEFHIEREGHFTVTVRYPDPPETAEDQQQTHFSTSLQEQVQEKDKRPAISELLDVAGVILLFCAEDALARAAEGLELAAQAEKEFGLDEGWQEDEDNDAASAL